MNNFEQLLSNTRELYDKELKEFLNKFFCPLNYTDYLLPDNASQDDATAVKEMFESKMPLFKRALFIIEKQPFCIEAIYVIYCLGEDELVSDYFSEIYQRKDNYINFTDYQKENYLKFLHFYGEFLLDIHSLKKAITVVRKRGELRGTYSSTDIDRLSYMYCLIEDKDAFLETYQNNIFVEPVTYLLLLSVLLKFDDEENARDVYGDMLERFYYASYIDHMWDLDDINEEEALEFRNAIELAFEEINSVPHFFDWCEANKEKVYRS